MKEGRLFGFLIYIVFGLYFINYSFAFYTLPDFVSEINKWIILVGGFLIIIGGINYLRASKKHQIPLFSQ